MERESVRRHHGQGGGRAGRRQKRGAAAQQGGRQRPRGARSCRPFCKKARRKTFRLRCRGAGVRLCRCGGEGPLFVGVARRAGERKRKVLSAQRGGGGEEKIQAGSNPLPCFLLQKGGSAVFYGRSAFSRHGTSLPPAFMDSVARYQRSSFFLRKAKKPAAPTIAIIATEEPIAIEDPHPPELPPAVVVAAVVPPGWVAFPPPAPVVVP